MDDPADHTAPPGAIGHRITQARTLSRLSTRQLATRARVDPALLTQVEQGSVPASPPLSTAVARALRLDVTDLYGQPYGPALTDPADDHFGIPALRDALDCGDDPQPVGPPLTTAELRARLDDCGRDRAAARYAQLTAALPDLLHHGHAVAAVAGSGAETETAWALLADAYLLAQTVAYRFGYLDLAALCNEHAREAATRSGDPLRPAVATAQRVLLRLHYGDYLGTLLLTDRAHTTLADQRTPAADSVRVALHLREALAHARNHTPDQAAEHIAAARELIARGIPPHPYPTVTVTEAIIDMAWVAVAVELDDPATALDRADRIKLPTGEAPAHLGRYWIDIARAATRLGDHPRAVDALCRARDTAPQLTRYHPQAREITHVLAEAERRDAESLTSFAQWAGITL
jgi:transcriptional regulator with XRE-family HTH domain